MPQPASCTVRTTNRPGMSPSSDDGNASATFEVEMESGPPSGMASRAFHREVEQHLRELVRVRHHGPEAVREAQPERDAIADGAGEELSEVLDQPC